MTPTTTNSRSVTLLLTLGLGLGCFDPAGDTFGAETDTPTTGTMSSSGTTSDTEENPPSSSSTTTTTTNTTTHAQTDTIEETESEGTFCGDREVEGDEVCDDGRNDGSYGSCEPDCSALAAYCGDGITQGGEGEDCDDGDDIDGDGCNINCAVSGSIIWEQTYSSNGPYSFDGMMGLRAQDDGNILAAIQSRPNEGDDMALLRVYSPDGDVLRTTNVDNGDGGTISLSRYSTPQAAIGRDGAYVLYDLASGDEQITQFIAGYSAGHVQQWMRQFSVGAGSPDFVFDVASNGQGFFGIEDYPANGLNMVGRINSGGGVDWEEDVFGSGSFYDVSESPNGDLMLVGSDAGQAVLQRRTAAGAHLWTTYHKGVVGGVVLNTGPNGASGLCWTDNVESTLRVRRFDSMGNEEWSGSYTDPDSEVTACYGLLVLGDGAIISSGVQFLGTGPGGTILDFIRFPAGGRGVDWTLRVPNGVGRNPNPEIVEADGKLLLGGSQIVEGEGRNAWIAKVEP